MRLIRDFGYMLDGDAGDELDAVDFDNGTPPKARIILISPTSVPRDSDAGGARCQRPEQPQLRSDVVFIDTGTGGRILSAGSICWAGALAWNGYENNVATLCENPLRDFLGV